ncbi:hypothetical protein [Aquimarina algicola]|uniref:Uncharacterized protein n=1 Tax=Aquimarina algicola TaxID=2589995 RepID=A0A504JGI9_9FLAO|nr:hypothetical protein [Aquimarina algicola]TPN86773.1 hypothetical protein FHK87_04000 [Aquimarina algicola]
MKNIAIIIIVFQSFQYLYSQKSFAKSNKFLVTTQIAHQDLERSPYVLNLVNSGDATNVISTLTIEDTELFEDVFITTLENPGLEGISEVVKLEVEYLACCAHVDAYYYLIKEDNTVVALPELKNVYCEGSDTDYQYTFPNQEYGIKGNILETQTYYKEDIDDTIKYVNLKQSFTWNNGDVDKTKMNSSALTGY